MKVCKGVLTKNEVKEVLKTLKKSEWIEGYSAASKKHKDNLECVNEELGITVAEKIMAHPTVHNKAFIKHITTPVFNKYYGGGLYGRHIDAFLQHGIRTDLSFTLFLAEPDTYKGGELVIEDVAHEPLKFKLEAGDMVLYPSGKPHYVTNVTEGERIAAIGWCQSLVEEEMEREILSKVVSVLRTVEKNTVDDKKTEVNLSFIYNNLLRKWSK